MTNYLKLLFIVFYTISFNLVSAQSPGDLTADIVPSDGFSTVENIKASFNNARRQEEMQLALPANSIDDLSLPDQSTWDGMSYDERVLFLLNDERISRAGVDYGSGAVLGLPFEGVGMNLDMASQNHSDDLLSNNVFAHCNPNPTNCPQGRIDAAVGTSCQEFVPFNENLYASFSSASGYTFPGGMAAGIYNWMYEDKSDGFGHRRMILFQGFSDNYGDIGKAGIIGVGVAVGGPYLGWSSGLVLTLNYFDPTVTCNEVLVVDTDDLPGACGTALLTLSGDIPTNIYDSNLIEVEGNIQNTAVVIFNATTSVTVTGEFTINNGADFTLNIMGCN